MLLSRFPHLPMTFSRICLGVLTALITPLSGAQQTAAPYLALNAGIHRIKAEIAADQPTRMQGLMQRKHLPVNHGMLFVFPVADRHCMWMRNTLIPLSVAFLDAEGKILNIENMQPQTEKNHCASAPARFALEMNSGWFASKGIRAGQRIGGIGKAPPPR